MTSIRYKRAFGSGVMGGGGKTYAQKLVAYFGASILAYWPMDEASGSAAVEVKNGYNGSYTGADLANTPGPFQGNAPYFDGINDFMNFYSAGIAGLFFGLTNNKRTFSLWSKVATGVWTDATEREILWMQGTEGGSNIFTLRRTVVHNQLSVICIGNGTNRSALYTTSGPVGWFHMGATVDGDAGELKMYYNGAQVDTTKTGAVAFSDTLSNTQTTLGSAGTTPLRPFKGWVAHPLILNRVATPTEMTALYSGAM